MKNLRLIKIKKEYFVEYDYIAYFTGKKETQIFKDYNNENLTLGNDKDFAESWIQTRNLLFN